MSNALYEVIRKQDFFYRYTLNNDKNKDQTTCAGLITRVRMGAGTQLRRCHGWGREKNAERMWLAEP